MYVWLSIYSAPKGSSFYKQNKLFTQKKISHTVIIFIDIERVIRGISITVVSMKSWRQSTYLIQKHLYSAWDFDPGPSKHLLKYQQLQKSIKSGFIFCEHFPWHVFGHFSCIYKTPCACHAAFVKHIRAEPLKVSLRQLGRRRRGLASACPPGMLAWPPWPSPGGSKSTGNCISWHGSGRINSSKCLSSCGSFT